MAMRPLIDWVTTAGWLHAIERGSSARSVLQQGGSTATAAADELGVAMSGMLLLGVNWRLVTHHPKLTR